jgi:hypothetical protein
MRTTIVMSGVLGILLAGVARGADDDKTPPQAAPMIALLKAAKATDATSFKNAYCKRIRDDKDQGDWDKNFKEAQGNLKKYFGDYDLKDFTFKFTGDKEKGKLSVSHKGKEAVLLGVIKEGDEWKLDER